MKDSTLDSPSVGDRYFVGVLPAIGSRVHVRPRPLNLPVPLPSRSRVWRGSHDRARVHINHRFQAVLRLAPAIGVQTCPHRQGLLRLAGRHPHLLRGSSQRACCWLLVQNTTTCLRHMPTTLGISSTMISPSFSPSCCPHLCSGYGHVQFNVGRVATCSLRSLSPHR